MYKWINDSADMSYHDYAEADTAPEAGAARMWLRSEIMEAKCIYGEALAPAARELYEAVCRGL